MKALLLIIVLAIPGLAWADWEANLSARPLGQNAAGLELTGTWRAKRQRARLEVQTPLGPRITITDQAAKKSWVLDEAERSYLEFDLEEVAGTAVRQLPVCAGDVDACLASQGFVKTGTGEANGLKCTTWERTTGAGGQRVTDKLWRPDGLKEVVLVKLTSTRADGTGMEFNLSEVKLGRQRPSLFRVPAGYSRAGGAPASSGPKAPKRGVRPRK